MDCSKAGQLILRLRKEKGMTQRQLADMLNISDKTISKWERGQGFPDVSLLRELSEVLGIDIGGILSGDVTANDTDGGNMKRVKFFVCPDCGNILTATGEPEISCCGRKIAPLIPQPEDEEHSLTIESVEDDNYVTFDHEMSKEHFLTFVAYAVSDRVLLIRLYPEQGGEVRFPKGRKGKLYFYCNRHGLRVKAI